MDGINSEPVPKLSEKKNHRQWLWFFIMFLIFGDFVTTWYGVAYMGLKEQNSFMSVVVDNRAWQLLALIKVQEFTFVYAIVSYMDKSVNKTTYYLKLLYIVLSLTILINTLFGNIYCLLGLC